jgi:hypothetical protein
MLEILPVGVAVNLSTVYLTVDISDEEYIFNVICVWAYIV